MTDAPHLADARFILKKETEFRKRAVVRNSATAKFAFGAAFYLSVSDFLARYTPDFIGLFWWAHKDSNLGPAD